MYAFLFLFYHGIAVLIISWLGGAVCRDSRPRSCTPLDASAHYRALSLRSIAPFLHRAPLLRVPYSYSSAVRSQDREQRSESKEARARKPGGESWTSIFHHRASRRPTAHAAKKAALRRERKLIMHKALRKGIRVGADYARVGLATRFVI